VPLRPRSISLRFTLWAGAALIASTAVSTAVGAREEQRALLTQVERHAGQLAELLAADSAQALFAFSAGDLENTVGAFARDSNVRVIEIRDTSGKVIKRHGDGDAAPREDLVVATREVRLAGEAIGSVTLGLSTAVAQDAVRAAWWRVALREAVDLVLLFGVLAWLVRRVISRPLARIAAGMREIADSPGDLARRVDVGSRDEVGELARQFNSMAGRLDESQKQVAQRIAELDGFVHVVAHDLKAPLLNIRGFAEMLRERSGGVLDADGQHCLQRLETNAERMEQLIFDLLKFARVGREAHPPEVVDLGELVEALCVELRASIDARGVNVSVRDTGVLWGGRPLLEQVFRNLLSNAIKYAGDTERPTVEVGIRDVGDMTECFVRDNGIGIDPAYHEKVFEIFQRLNDVEVEGSGVGLATVKKVVDHAGGRVWVESQRGEGATFYFTWPRRDAVEESVVAAATPLPETS